MNARTTKCQNWRRHADTIAHKSEKMANLQAAVYDRRYFVDSRKTGAHRAPLQYGGKPGALALARTAPAVLQLVLREEAVVIGVQTVKHFGAALPFLA